MLDTLATTTKTVIKSTFFEAADVLNASNETS
jgi:hypothetical protein